MASDVESGVKLPLQSRASLFEMRDVCLISEHIVALMWPLDVGVIAQHWTVFDFPVDPIPKGGFSVLSRLVSFSAR